MSRGSEMAGTNEIAILVVVLATGFKPCNLGRIGVDPVEAFNVLEDAARRRDVDQRGDGGRRCRIGDRDAGSTILRWCRQSDEMGLVLVPSNGGGDMHRTRHEDDIAVARRAASQRLGQCLEGVSRTTRIAVVSVGLIDPEVVAGKRW